MDSILLYSVEDPKVGVLLGKMGYRVVTFDCKEPLLDVISRELIDLVIIDAQKDLDAPELCEVLRTESESKRLPIVIVAKDRLMVQQLKEKRLKNLEVITGPYTVAGILSKIATQLRLRKMMGSDSSANPSLSEINASLRDLNDRFQKELEEAQQIQQSLLPKSLPTDPRFDLASCYLPLEDVGGDWYYAQKLSDGQISVQIADVTGHGLSAAFIGSMTKLALAAASDHRPDLLLKDMNRLMAPQMPAGRFVTIASYLYEPGNGKLQFARGGHPPGFWLKRAQGEVNEILGDGFPIGFFEEGEYTLETLELEQNDVFVMVTDALTETQNMDGKVYGNEGVIESLKRTRVDQAAEDILRGLLGDFREFCQGRALKDDVTAIVLKRRG
ncbi:MAG: SpoIIE family protein phosphatase [Bdellovibrionales bacterium]|nr:SpoIIE family protein phosphatase [Bdellovibrionales bacterium]